MSRALAVLTAAGSGTRLGARGPKALVELGGAPLVVRAARGLAEAGVAGIVVTAPGDHLGVFASVFPGGRLRVEGSRAGDGIVEVPVEVVAGSPASRQASVARGLAALAALGDRCGLALEERSVVLVHDAARCLTPPAAIARVIDAVAAGHEAVIPAIAVTDTLKQVAERVDEGVRPVVATPDRSTLVSVQTPQGFAWGALRRAHESAAARADSESTAATDDAGLVEAAGGRVVVVEGDPLALKVTTPVDLALAELLLSEKARPNNFIR